MTFVNSTGMLFYIFDENWEIMKVYTGCSNKKSTIPDYTREIVRGPA